MVTVKTERIPNCWDVIIVIIIIIIIKIWNDKNSYLLSAVEYRLLISGKREHAAGAEIKLKKKKKISLSPSQFFKLVQETKKKVY